MDVCTDIAAHSTCAKTDIQIYAESSFYISRKQQSLEILFSKLDG